MAYVDEKMISPDTFRARRAFVRHKQITLANALGCSIGTIRNFEQGLTKRLYSVRWEDLKRELKLDQVA
jgi:DNA-binding transcriptional regulator YiaG